MKYPLINKKELSKENKSRFKKLKYVINDSVTFDNQENQLGLTKKDIDLIVYNAATSCIAMIAVKPC